jgi:hypothetical protein
MPNWCENRVEISAIEPEAQKKFRIMVLAMDEGHWFNYVLPVPEGLENLEDYSWRVDNWGTGREAVELRLDVHNDVQLTATFDTAWSPPIGVYEELHRMGFTVRATYEEPGMCFAGRVKAEVNKPFDNTSWDTW